MYIQRTRQANPYASYNALLEQRGLIGDRGAALRGPEPRLSQLSAPLLKHQMLAHARRYERLGGMLSGILPTLGELGSPLQTLASRLATKFQTPTTSAATPGSVATTTSARAATLAGSQAITLNGGGAETTAMLMSEAPRIRQGTSAPATAATLTLDKVSLNTSQSTKATLQGTNLILPGKGKGKGVPHEADFGSLDINGVTNNLGVFQGSNETLAVQFIADRINANQANTVTASVDANNKRVVLTSKVAGTAGTIRIDGVTADSDGNTKNNVSTGFQTGDLASGQDGSSDFGSVTINGVTTDFGVLSNSQQTARSATQWMVDSLNANTANGFTASVGGVDQDQISLTSKELGSQSGIRIDQVTTDSDRNALNDGISGFTAGASAQGQDADPGVTDFGSVTINGVTSTFGVLSNDGLTQQGAAQFMIERLNADSESTVVASLGGADQDRVVLTAKTPGSAGSIRIDQVSPDTDGLDDDGSSGWVAGSRAAGQDGASDATDFGSVTINGVTTDFGVLGSPYTATSALQYMVDRLNQTNSTLTASAQDGKLVLSSKDTGGTAALSIDAVNSDSDGVAGNDRGLGFVVGQAAAGQDGKTTSEGHTAGSGVGATASSASATEPRAERIVPSDEASRFLGKTEQVVQSLNDYLQAIKDEKEDLPKSLMNFRAQMLSTLGKEEKTFARLGIRLKDDRLELDAATLEKALEEDPDSITATFKHLQKAMESNVGSQSFALDQMRSFTKATSESASSISQVAASIYQMTHRAKSLSWMLEQVKPAESALRDQADRLKKLAEEKKPQRAEREEQPKAPKETEREPATFGLLRSPVPIGFFQRDLASRGSAARWPDER